ncbi:hypothetical protein FM076_15520 [Streptomyces albus subsp. chlorinus]|uniref:hypothetical protein n=1 Tax=Streptomyces albus TaxID=1888 RepID=UPI00156F3ECC|nr:hypothetical protein [Streptomyces albus]NSC22509.1 hypothetical protein [Streptomyces albus subsp. chlorinus]
MPIANDLRKTLTDPTPLYFAAGVVDKLREEAPQALAAVRETDPKEVQAKLAQQAKETQAKVTETLSGLDTDLKKLREQAQHLALQGVGFAAEYAVKAREAYDELAVRGREAVKNWRGEGERREAPEVTVEREPVLSVKVAEPPAEETPDTGVTPKSPDTGVTPKSTATTNTNATSTATTSTNAKSTAAKSTAARSASAKSASNGAGTGTSATRKSTGTTARKPASKQTEAKKQNGEGAKGETGKGTES